MVANNYRRNDWAPYVYRTTDGGKVWKRLAYGEDVPAHALCVVQDPVAADLLFLGTEEGLYFSVDRGVNWRMWSHDIPSVPVRDMVIHPREGDLVLGTFGRAAYVIEDLAPLRALASEGPGLLKATFRTFDAAAGYQVPNPRPAGSRFMADHVWEGPNRQRSAHGHIYIDPDTADAHGEMAVAIVNVSGDTLRRMTRDAEAGWQRFSWRGDTDGVRWPSRDLETDDDPVGGGPAVLPGDYLAIFELGTHRDTMRMTVKADPRVPFDRAGFLAASAHRAEVQAEVKRLANLMQELAEVNVAVGALKAVWKHLPDSVTATVDSLAGDLDQRVTNIHDMLWTPKDFVGYDHVTVRVMDQVYAAMGSTGEAPTPNEMRRLVLAREAIDDVDGEVRACMAVWEALLEASSNVTPRLEDVHRGIRGED